MNSPAGSSPQRLLDIEWILKSVSTLSDLTATIFDAGDLLQQAARMLAANFNLPAVEIYTLDEAGNRLVQLACSAEPSAAGQTVPLENASADETAPWFVEAVRTARPRIEPDCASPAGASTVQAGLAVPLVLMERVIGLLILYAATSDAFSDDMLPMVNTLAMQLVVAVQNTRLLKATEAQAQRLGVLTEMGAVLNVTTELDEAFQTAAHYIKQVLAVEHICLVRLGETPTGLFEVLAATDWAEFPLPVGKKMPLTDTIIDDAIRRKTVVVVPALSDVKQWDAARLADYGLVSAMVAPLVTGWHTVGTIGVFCRTPRQFSADERDLMMQIASLMGATLENLRLFGQVHATLTRTQALHQVTHLLMSADTQAFNLQDVVEAARQALFADAFSLTLFDPEKRDILQVWQAVNSPSEAAPAADLWSYQTLWQGLKGYVLENRTPVLLPKTTRENARQSADEQQDRQERGIGSMMIAPVFRSDQLMGLVEVENLLDNPDFVEEDMNLLTNMASQIALSIENRRLFDQMQRRSTQLVLAAEVGTVAATTLNMGQLLQRVVDMTKSRFGLYHAHIYTVDESGDTLILAAGAGDIGRQMVEQGWHIPLFQPKSLVAQAARTRKGVIVNNVAEEENWFQNPLLPLTQSEMAVPMIMGHRVLGVLDVQSEAIGYFAEDDIHVHTTLAAQIAVALEHARLYKQAQTRVRREQILREVTDQVWAATDVDTVMRVAVRELNRVFGRRAFLRLDDVDDASSGVTANQDKGMSHE